MGQVKNLLPGQQQSQVQRDVASYGEVPSNSPAPGTRGAHVSAAVAASCCMQPGAEARLPVT